MPSKTEIISNALLEIGAHPIASLTDGGNNATLGVRLWDTTRDAVIRAHPWNDSLDRATLTQLGTTPSFDFDFQYQLPNTPLWCLRAIRLEDPTAKFKIEGRKLLTDEDEAKLLFLFRNDNTETWDALHVDAHTARLAARMAYSVTGGMSAAEKMWELYKQRVREARTMDGMEGTPEVLESSELLDARFGA